MGSTKPLVPGQLDCGNELAMLEYRFLRRVVPIRNVEVGDRKLSFSSRAQDANGRIQRGQGHAHIRWMGGNALVASSKNRVITVEAVQSGAARSRLALVASPRDIAEIRTAGTLQQ